jgi:hypothetical protein
VAVLQAAAYGLWILGGFALLAALIAFVVSLQVWSEGRIARATPRSDCGRVRAEARPVRVSGTSAPGPWGPLRGRLSGVECVWYRDRVFRMHWTDVMFAQLADMGGQPILAMPYKGVPAISVGAQPEVLGRSGSRGTGCAVLLGLTGVASFVTGALLLRVAGVLG